MNNGGVQDTIAALATPPGRGGVGVVRISGRLAPLWHLLSSGIYRAHAMHYGPSWMMMAM